MSDLSSRENRFYQSGLIKWNRNSAIDVWKLTHGARLSSQSTTLPVRRVRHYIAKYKYTRRYRKISVFYSSLIVWQYLTRYCKYTKLTFRNFRVLRTSRVCSNWIVIPVLLIIYANNIYTLNDIPVYLLKRIWYFEDVKRCYELD